MILHTHKLTPFSFGLDACVTLTSFFVSPLSHEVPFSSLLFSFESGRHFSRRLTFVAWILGGERGQTKGPTSQHLLRFTPFLHDNKRWKTGGGREKVKFAKEEGEGKGVVGLIAEGGTEGVEKEWAYMREEGGERGKGAATAAWTVDGGWVCTYILRLFRRGSRGGTFLYHGIESPPMGALDFQQHHYWYL